MKSNKPARPDSVQHAHDKFFKEAFSRLDVLTDFIRAFLPPEIAEQINLNKLTRRQDSFVDEELGEHFVDMLYESEFGSQPITIALLLEHKSYVEEYPHFQLNRYLLNYWSSELKAKKTLKPVIPIVIYHGKRRWKLRPMNAYFPNLDNALFRFIPAFDYIFINLSSDDEAQMRLLQSNYARLTAALLRDIHQKHLLKRTLEQLAGVINELVAEEQGARFVQTAYLYVHWASDLPLGEIFAIFRTISIQAERVAMSAAETLIQQGMQQGMQQGIQQGMQQGFQEATLRHIRGLMALGMDTQSISKAFDLSPETVEQYMLKIQQEQKN